MEPKDYMKDPLVEQLSAVSEATHNRLSASRGPAGWAASNAMAKLQEAQMWVVNALSAQDQMDTMIEQAAAKAASTGKPGLTFERGDA